jgi:TRAP-type mannitol/chloroaromatic compound transport system substrate-binding protein
LVFIADYITEASGGRIIVEPTAPGAIVPVVEQLAAVAAGVTPAMLIYPGYFPGVLPIMGIIADGGSLLLEPWDVYQFFEMQRGGRVRELVEKELARFGDVVLVEPIYRVFDVIMVSRVPVRGVEDLEGLKLRSGDISIIETMTELGASLTWFPGPEIYPNLAAGVVDAVTFAHVHDSIAMGFHEVSEYWIKQPFFPSGTELFIVNGAVWRNLPDDLKAIVRSAVMAANTRGMLASKKLIEAGWAKAEELGVEVIEWSPEDYLKWMATAAGLLDGYAKDPASTEVVEILKEFLIEWEPELAKAVGLL